MHVVVEGTPNPTTRMFLPGARVAAAPRKWTREDEADAALLTALFAIPSVVSVLANEDAISVSLSDEAFWGEAQPAIVSAVVEHAAAFISQEFEPTAEHDGDYDEADAATVQKIKELIFTHIRPAVARDGGDIVFRSFRNGVLSLDMRGACSGCPSS